MNITSYLGLLPFFLSASLALACALSFKYWHKRRSRLAPLQGKKLGHLPGQQLLDRINDHDTEILLAVMLMYIAAPIMFSVWAGMQIDWNTQHWGVLEIACVAGTVVLFGLGLRSYIRHYKAAEQAHDGLVGERVTGMQLNRLVARDCLVLNDLPAEGFNIDHVVVAPGAIYVVETKSFRKPRSGGNAGSTVKYEGGTLVFPDFVSRKPLEQAERNAKWLARELREALGQQYPIVSAVALPGWFIQPLPPAKQTGTVVFTPIGRGAEFMADGPERINAIQRGLIAKALALRYPNLS